MTPRVDGGLRPPVHVDVAVAAYGPSHHVVPSECHIGAVETRILTERRLPDRPHHPTIPIRVSPDADLAAPGVRLHGAPQLRRADVEGGRPQSADIGLVGRVAVVTVRVDREPT